MTPQPKTLTLEETLTIARTIPVSDWRGEYSSRNHGSISYRDDKTDMDIFLSKRQEGFFKKQTLGHVSITIWGEDRTLANADYDSSEALALYDYITQRKKHLAKEKAKRYLVGFGLSAQRVEEIFGGQE